MQSKSDLEQQEKNLKKKLRDLGGLLEVFPDIKENYQAQIDHIKTLLKQIPVLEQYQSAIFGKGAKLKKEASAAIEDAENKLSELTAAAEELEKKITPAETIPQARKEELAALAKACNQAEMENLSFEEMAYCLVITLSEIMQLQRAEQKDEISIKRYTEQQKKLQRTVGETLRTLDSVYVAFSPATRCPYVDVRDQEQQSALWIFSKEEYARNCKLHFAKEYIFTDVVEVKKEMLQNFAKNLPRWGFNTLILNNGVHNLVFPLAAWIGTVNYSCPVNPMLHMRRLDFYQALLAFNKVPQTNHTLYERYHNPQILKAKESMMLFELSRAQYTVVMKSVMQKDAQGKETEMTEIPTVKKDDTPFLLIFTDMLEYSAWKDSADFKTEDGKTVAKVLSFENLCNMANDTKTQLLLDRNGWCFEMTEQHRTAIAQIAKQVAEQTKKPKE